MSAQKDILKLYGQCSLRLAQLLKEGVQLEPTSKSPLKTTSLLCNSLSFRQRLAVLFETIEQQHPAAASAGLDDACYHRPLTPGRAVHTSAENGHANGADGDCWSVQRVEPTSRECLLASPHGPPWAALRSRHSAHDIFPASQP